MVYTRYPSVVRFVAPGRAAAPLRVKPKSSTGMDEEEEEEEEEEVADDFEGVDPPCFILCFIL